MFKIKTHLLIFIILTVIIIELIIYNKFIFSHYLYLYGWWDIGSDTYWSYFPSYYFFVNKLLHLKFQSWSFEMVTGTSVFTAFSTFTDPFFVLLLFFNKLNFAYGILLISLLKILVIAILFYKYLTYFKINWYLIYLGSIYYSFSSYLIIWGQHYFFSSMVLYFSFTMVTLERYIRTQKYNWLLVSLFLMFINSVVFSFMSLIFMFFYFIVRVNYLYKNQENFKIWPMFFKSLLLIIIAMLLGAFILIPEIDLLSNSQRTVVHLSIPVIFPLREILVNIIRCYSANILGVNNYLGIRNYYEDFFGYTSVLFPLLLPIYFKILSKSYKKHIWIYFSMFLCILPLIFPLFNSLLNAFITITYRYSYFCMLLETMVVIFTINNIMVQNNRKILILSLIFNLIIFSLLAQYFKVFFSSKGYLVLLMLISYTIILLNFNKKFYKILLLIFLVSELCITNYQSVFSERIPIDSSVINKHLDYFDDTTEIVNKIHEKDNSFYRINKNYLSQFLSDSLFHQYYGFDGYNSLINPGYFNFIYNLGIKWPSQYSWIPRESNYIMGLDEHLPLYTLLNQKYQIQKDSTSMPFGYKLLFSHSNYKILENEFALPVGVFFPKQNCLNEFNFNKLNIDEKQAILYKNYIMQDCDANHLVENKDVKPLITSTPMLKSNYTIKLFSSNNKDDITDKIHINFKHLYSYINVNLKLKTDYLTNGTVYITSSNQNFGESSLIKFNVTKIGLNKINLNLDYRNISKIRIELYRNNKNNKIKIEDILINQNNYSQYINKVNFLKKTSPISDYSRDKPNIFKGVFENKESGMLIFYIPFDKYWKAKINGKKVIVQKVNIGFIGIPLQMGKNSYEIYYQNDGFIIGVLISIISMFIYLIFLIIKK
ncbi:MAG TPA: YfhO family protein [Burkholderiales bacterium]|nr:YfhO family protein [Burkholderiales bacterium]